MMAAFSRGHHRFADAAPWILDDPFALLLVGPRWRRIAENSARIFPPDLDRRTRAGIALRTRYAEDRLLTGAFTQYVLLGAGLDAFAWRRPDLLRSIRVFEVDHPASQTWKRQRVDDLGLPTNSQQTFVPVDFEHQSLADRLTDVGFEWGQATLFSWLGVTMYLTPDAVEATLRTVAGAAPGSEIAFSYGVDRTLMDDDGRRFAEILAPVVADVGETLSGGTTPGDLDRLVAGCGLRVVDHPTHHDLVGRYFVGRPDGLRPYTAEGLVTAAAP